MNPENTARLFREFPALFRGRFEPIMQNLMAFSFECGDGWYEILHTLCVQISKYAAAQGLRVKAVQVKEKYGTLRVYVDGEDEFIESLIADAEEASTRTCDVCGERGVLWDRGGWLATRCEEHIRA